MKKLISLLAIALAVPLVSAEPLTPEQLVSQIDAAPKAERVRMKTAEIVKHASKGQFTRSGLRIDIQSVQRIEGGIEVYAKAWRGGKQLGFGDGTIETERFLIYNPPVLVEDPQGTITRRWSVRGQQRQRSLRYDPAEALKQDLAHTIQLVGKEGTVIPGTVGRTTSTFYPDAHTETSSVDGFVSRGVGGAGETWATIRSSAGTGAGDANAATSFLYIQTSGTSNQYLNLWRSIFLFDTSAIADTDTVSAATLSLFGNLKSDSLGAAPTINIYTSTPASNTALVNGDYNQIDTTEQSTAITYANWSTSAYNDFVLNDVTQVSKTGVSKFGAREATYDAPGVAPSWVGGKDSDIEGYFADQTGTTNDPKLVVTHTAAATDTPQVIWFGLLRLLSNALASS